MIVSVVFGPAQQPNITAELKRLGEALTGETPNWTMRRKA
jgi:hypothetical protein